MLAVLIFTQQAVTRSSLDRASQDLLAAREAFNSLVTDRADLAVRQTRLIAELPTFRSLLRDSQARADIRTVDQMAGAYCRKLEADFCVVTDEKGAWIGRANYAETEAVPGLDRAVPPRAPPRARCRDASRRLFLIVAQPFSFDLAVDSEFSARSSSGINSIMRWRASLRRWRTATSRFCARTAAYAAAVCLWRRGRSSKPRFKRNRPRLILAQPRPRCMWWGTRRTSAACIR